MPGIVGFAFHTNRFPCEGMKEKRATAAANEARTWAERGGARSSVVRSAGKLPSTGSVTTPSSFTHSTDHLVPV